MKTLPPTDPATNTIYLTLEEAADLQDGQVPPGVEVRIRDEQIEGTPLYGDQLELDEEDEAALARVEARREEEFRRNQAQPPKPKAKAKAKPKAKPKA